ncbi:drug:h+ antiporter [Malassezia pachydermatis]|uniref:Drug:h+ antiporter n=1 Tax=Malassezia pachydermatis TaxID=77020 RepID=A0A0N0RSM4_9BASI|nr:drug:h+ antiporter [Malassezia pachydermatis]KOS15703.1 drug:h+ antiporter [Malassezia pachydermatis]
MQSWDDHIDHVVEETPLISLRTGHTKDREHTQTMLLLYAALFTLALAVSLDGMSFNLFLNYACSEFQALSSVGTVMIVQQLVRAVSKPVVAKISDCMGRTTSFSLVIALYAMGYALMASATQFSLLLAGAIVQSLGATGVGVLQSVIIADTSSVQWRGFLIGLVNLPFLLNFALAGPLVDFVMRTGGWRLGFALWIVIIPLASIPLILLLVIGYRRARRRGYATRSTTPLRAQSIVRDLDLVGMSLLSGCLTLILIPVSFHGFSRLTEPDHPDRAMMLAGFVFLGAFLFWERYADAPIIPLPLLSNFTVASVCLIAALDFAGFYLSWTYLSPFIQIIKDWDQVRTAYFVTTQNVMSTITGVVVGSCMAYTRRLKRYMVAGYFVRMAGVLLMIYYRSPVHTAVAMLTCQVLQGVGGGALALTMQVAVQVAVDPTKVVVVTAFELLVVEVGAAFGSALASAIVTGMLPSELSQALPMLPLEELQHLQGNLDAVLAYPLDSDIRIGVSKAWVQVMKHLCLASVLVQLPAMVLSWFVPDMDLRNPANTVTVIDTTVSKGSQRSSPPWRTTSSSRSSGSSSSLHTDPASHV